MAGACGNRQLVTRKAIVCAGLNASPHVQGKGAAGCELRMRDLPACAQVALHLHHLGQGGAAHGDLAVRGEQRCHVSSAP